MVAVNTNNEIDTRLRLLNSILTCPHKDLDKIQEIHSEIAKNDPVFYKHLAAWYRDNGQVRDHTDAFVINLCLSKSEESRNVGLAILRDLPPHQIANVVDFMIGGKEKQYDEVSKSVKGKNVKMKKLKVDGKGNPVVKKYGLNVNVPRSVRTEISRYFAERAADPEWFDSMVLTARKHVKFLYAKLQLSHERGGRITQILFKNNPPADSKIADLKALSKLSDPNEQAKIIIEKKIPYRIACNVLTQLTPAALLALITNMTDQELINNISSLQKRGVMDNPDLKKIVDQRLVKAKRSNKVSSLKASIAADNSNVDEETRKALKDVSTAQLQKKHLVINRNVALLIDKSGSMEQAITLGKQVGSAIATAMGEGFRLEAVAFDSTVYPVKPQGKDLDSWQKAMNGIQAGSSTGCGTAVMYLSRCEQVDQIVIITDEGETDSPNFSAAYDKYVQVKGVSPSVRIIRCGTHLSSKIYDGLKKKENVDVERMDITGADHYSIPNILTFLNRSSKMDLLFDIMSYELPKRRNS